MSESELAVLVIEDDAAFGSLVANDLRQRGLRASVVRDGSEALAELTSGDFSAVVTDLHMQGLSGL